MSSFGTVSWKNLLDLAVLLPVYSIKYGDDPSPDSLANTWYIDAVQLRPNDINMIGVGCFFSWHGRGRSSCCCSSWSVLFQSKAASPASTDADTNVLFVVVPPVAVAAEAASPRMMKHPPSEEEKYHWLLFGQGIPTLDILRPSRQYAHFFSHSHDLSSLFL